MTKVALVGAGSVEFSRRLVVDLLSFPELRELEIALHDIDAGRLETAVAVSRVTAEQLGASPRITGKLDRRAALDGADAVFNMVQIGGHAATVRDIEIPERYGLRQSVGDTIGVGGVFRALRTAPHMLALGRDLAEVAPDGWLLNYTNPMAMLCALVYRGTPTTRVVGLCHSVQGTVGHLASLAGVEPREVTYLAAGVNHQAFVLRLEHDGEDLYPRLRERLDEPEERRRVRVELYRRFGYFPTESSEHGAEYLPWLMRREGELKRFRIPVGEIVRRSEENLGAYEAIRAALARGELPAAERSEEYAAPIVHSLATGEPRVINGNVANHGLVPGLPDATCVEVPASSTERASGRSPPARPQRRPRHPRRARSARRQRGGSRGGSRTRGPRRRHDRRRGCFLGGHSSPGGSGNPSDGRISACLTAWSRRRASPAWSRLARASAPAPRPRSSPS